jgi:hypothetical protein
MIHRLLNIPLDKDDFDKELKIIKQIASNNGYDPNTVTNILNKKNKSLMTHKYIYPRITHVDNTPWRKILYLDHSTNTYKNKLTNIFIPAFYTNNNLNRYLFNNKDKAQKMDSSGVYRIWCSDCDANYIGQTCRAITTRIKEHDRAFRGLSCLSEMADHCFEHNHSFDMDNAEILHSESRYTKLIALETLEINNNKHKIINRQIPFPSPLLTTHTPSIPKNNITTPTLPQH